MIPHRHSLRERTTLHSVNSGFVFAPRYNRVGKRDGVYFTTRARRFCAFHGFSDPLIFDNDGDDDAHHRDDNENTNRRRREIYEAIEASPGKLDVVAYFGHGGPTSLASAGIGPMAVPGFVDRLAAKCNARIVVILYACLCGSRGGIAEQMRNEFRRNAIDATVFAHSTSGDTASNPYKRRFPGGNYLVEPGTPRFEEWHSELKNSNLWMYYPFMEPEDYQSP